MKKIMFELSRGHFGEIKDLKELWDLDPNTNATY